MVLSIISCDDHRIIIRKDREVSPPQKKKITPWNFFSTWLPYFCLLQLLEPKNPSQNCVLWGQIFPWTLLSDLSINERIYKQKDRVISVLAVHLVVLTIAFITMDITLERFIRKCLIWTIDTLNQTQNMFWESKNCSRCCKKIA